MNAPISPTGSPAKTTRKFSPPKTVEINKKDDKEFNKENGEKSSTVRSKLNRLGKLYSGKHLMYSLYMCVYVVLRHPHKPDKTGF